MESAGASYLETKYRQLQPALLRHLRYAHATLAEDIAADVWVEAARNLPKFVGDDAAFRAWVFALARRRLIDSYRRAGRRPADPLTGEELTRQAADDPEGDVVADLSTRGAIAAVHHVLPPDQAEIVLLRVVGGFGVERVARMTGRRQVNVRVIQHRALRRLARELDVDLQRRTA